MSDVKCASESFEPGWLQQQFDDLEALRRANKKIKGTAAEVRRGPNIGPVVVAFTVEELAALDRMIPTFLT